MAKLLIIDDSELILDMLKMALGGHDLSFATDGDSAAAAVSRETFDAIITDLNFPGLGDSDAVTLVRTHGADTTPVFLMSGKAEAVLEATATELGAQGSLSKDLGLPGMAAKIEMLLADL